jgi:hypothetical protein
MNSMLLREAFCEAHPVLIHATNQIVRNANVERPADLAGEDVDPIRSLDAHQEAVMFAGSYAVADHGRK